MNSVLANVKRIHIIGIGGSGTYPLVQILHSKGYHITGSDNNPGHIIDMERKMGITVAIGQSVDNIPPDAEAVIYSAAISPQNPELQEAARRKLPLIPRAQALHYLSQQFSNTIGISGTHGKTTTSALLTQILLEAGKDPTAVIGGKLPAINGYGRAGNSPHFVCEACEFQNTYHSLDTDIAVILNVDEDHLEFFHNLKNIIASFHTFASQSHNMVIANGDDKNTMAAVQNILAPVVTFGLAPTNDYYAAHISHPTPMETTFELYHKQESFGFFTLCIPGEHQIYNSLAAIVAALSSGVSLEDIRRVLPHFLGAGRRFEIVSNSGNITVVDDYAHHPKEITATLKAARTLGFPTIWAVHQPFTYSRTALLLEDFATALSLADYAVISDIMGGREENTYGVHATDLSSKINGAIYLPTFSKIAEYVALHAQPGDFVITLGCGDVYKCAQMIATKIEHTSQTI